MPPRPRPRLLTQTPQSTLSSSSRICPQCLSNLSNRTPSRQASSVPAKELRKKMYAWLNGPGEAFRHPMPNSTNYLSAYSAQGRLLRLEGRGNGRGENAETDSADPDAVEVDESALPLEERSASNMPGQIPKESASDLRPFPVNTEFESQPVLSEELRQEIWKRVKIHGQSVRVVSAALGVEMRRVGAVVRLVELEREMITQGKPLAKPYAKAVLAMLPTTPYNPGQRPVTHEPINDLPVHRLTQPQIFYPVSESRHFTRTDAGRVFSAAPRIIEANESSSFKQQIDPSILKPAEERIPHPQLVVDEQEKMAGTTPSERLAKYAARMKAEEDAIAAQKARQAEKEAREIQKVEHGRWEFRFRDVKVSRETVGLDGRGEKGVGSRYGVPSMERKRGTVKIPTSVDA